MVANLSDRSSSIDYDELVKEDRIHSRLYYDEAIFQQELEQVWYRQVEGSRLIAITLIRTD